MSKARVRVRSLRKVISMRYEPGQAAQEDGLTVQYVEIPVTLKGVLVHPDIAKVALAHSEEIVPGIPPKKGA